MIRKFEMHSSMDEGDRAAIRSLPTTLRTYEPASYMVREGDPPKHCAILVSGYAFRQKITSAGARQIVSLHIPGDIVDLQNLYLDVADHSVQSLTRAEFCLIPRAMMRDLVQSRVGITRAVLINILIEASILREWVLNIGRRDARSRLAHLLCEFALRLDAQGIAAKDGYELPMNQEQVADTLGLTPVHVNRTLRALEKDGLLARKGRFISFPEWEALRNVADFQGRYLHLSQQQC